MTQKSCHTCNRDISKPSLVRCREDNCPLKSIPEHSSRGLLAGLGGFGALVILAIGGYSFISSPTDTSTSISSDTPSVEIGDPGRNLGSQSNSSGKSWFSSIFSSSSGNQNDDLGSGVPKITLPDPRAASRVSTFSCAGSLSAARSLVCTNWDLAITDYNLSLLYTSALGQSRNPSSMRAAQAVWRRKLDQLGRDPALIQNHYNERSAELSKIGG